MAKVLILGGGFGGVVAAERLAEQLSDEHQITLVSRNRQFIFYPALVRLAFGKCSPKDVSFDLRHTMLNRRVNFVEAEVAHIDPFERKVTIAHGQVEGKLPYDYLVFALGRRLATEKITGFYEHAHHLLNVDKAIKFGQAINEFKEGRAVLGQCLGARLPVPVYETAFALARTLEKKGQRDRVRITVVSPETIESNLRDANAGIVLKQMLDKQQIELLEDFRITSLTQNSATTNDGDVVDFNLLMLVPPFQGSPAAHYMEVTDDDGYIHVDSTMRVMGQERIYAVGDCVSFSGPKMGHMAVRQSEIAAVNLAAEIVGHEPTSHYSHEMRFVIDEAGGEGLYMNKNIWTDEPATVRQNRFWSWAKHVQQRYLGSYAFINWGQIMDENRTIKLVEIPIGGRGGFIWNRLHAERENICDALIRENADDRKESLQARLRKLDDVLDRLMSGSYGNCSKCGGSIDEAELGIDPALALCRDCWTLDHDPIPTTVDGSDVVLETLNSFDTIMLRTHNSEYRILLLDPKTGRGLVEGGDYLVEPSEGLLRGSAAPGYEFKAGAISIGCRLEIWVEERALLTSPIESVHVKHNAEAESISNISAALH